MNKYKSYSIIGIFLILVFISTNIFGASACINPRNIPNLAMITSPTFETIDIDPAISSTSNVVIEVISGGRYGSDRDQYHNISKPIPINIWLNRETTPIYINCYEADPSRNAQDGSSGWAKLNLLETYIVTTDNRYYTDNTPEDILNTHYSDIAGQLALANVRLNTLNTNFEDLPDNFDEFKIYKNYENLGIDTNDGVKWLSLIFIGMGLILLMMLLFIKNEE